MKLKSKLLMMALIGVLSIGAFPITVKAQVPDNVDTSVIDEDESEEDIEEATGPLTPDGNLTIVDDYGKKNEAGKQFITVTTKDGNIFYIIIDRDDTGENTVHFLNLVDEQDLMSLLDDDEKEELEKQKEAVATPAPTTENTESEDTDTPDDSKKKTTKDSGKGNIAVICILLGMAAVGGLYFYSNKGSFIKKKKGPIIDDGEEYIEIPVESDNKDSADSTDE
ncbi:protein of unknown function [Pseudobutyrivibrio sp. YE44]|uniref:DUF4366 domain-containing protein n=1 Tax=Pseudobutyrivibrio sp. YE44 TaxID=1520802 RepID=UPI00087EFE8E|nr:DUF4366 domain-containing protein [Pseudobutyrivibrio sp. YE44]SDB06899.1 protein of unknown function [Pseudobutyrivibrio sp. YE44]